MNQSCIYRTFAIENIDENGKKSYILYNIQTSKLDWKDQEKKKKSFTYPFNNTLIDFITSARIKPECADNLAIFTWKTEEKILY